MKKQVTLKTLSEKMNLSVSAISKALHGAPNISPDTIRAVRALANELNYQPNYIAKSLRTNETKTLGLIISDSSLLFFASMIEQIEKTAALMGYSIILCSAYSSVEKEKKAVVVLNSKRIDGLLLASSMLTAPEHKSFLDSFGIPYIFLVRPPEYNNVNYVINDNQHGAFAMVDYLIKSGSRRIHFLNLSEDITTHTSRFIGYKSALEANGLACDPALVYHVNPAVEAGYAVMNRILNQAGPVSAVFCGCDVIAVGAMESILEHGLQIPADIRVASYDDIEFAEFFRVPLTTVRHPRVDIGRIGTERLIETIQKKCDCPIQVIIEPQLILRKST